MHPQETSKVDQLSTAEAQRIVELTQKLWVCVGLLQLVKANTEKADEPMNDSLNGIQ